MRKAEPDRHTVLAIGNLIHATRKHLGMNQTYLAPRLGLDQSALSRVESGKQMLTAAQWFLFTDLAGISPEAPRVGYIELSRPESSMKLPARYAFEKHTKVRGLLPMLDYARSTLGERGFTSFLGASEMDEEFFLNLNASINFNFVLDLAQALLKKTGMSGKDAAVVTRTAGEDRMHGALHHLYDHVSANPLDLIVAYVGRQEDYGSNFSYEVLDRGRSNLDVSVTPKSHMEDFKYRSSPAMGEFLAYYDKGYFENFSTYGGKSPLRVSIQENLYKGDSRCVYRMKSAAS